MFLGLSVYSKVKQCDVKWKGRRARKRQRQSEQAACKLWVEQHKTCHMYGKETFKSFRTRKAKQHEISKKDLGSKCGSLATEMPIQGSPYNVNIYEGQLPTPLTELNTYG
uniref:Uncharacterized protein n=1 Tax=Amphimedon queenslandica TaxID=400682 RepID=A0A1X7VER9_AMPQE